MLVMKANEDDHRRLLQSVIRIGLPEWDYGVSAHLHFGMWSGPSNVSANSSNSHSTVLLATDIAWDSAAKVLYTARPNL